jgi:hypothetical protein
MNSVSNELLPFMVRQSHDSLTLLSFKNVMFFSALPAGHSSSMPSEANLGARPVTCFCVSGKLKERKY